MAWGRCMSLVPGPAEDKRGWSSLYEILTQFEVLSAVLYLKLEA